MNTSRFVFGSALVALFAAVGLTSSDAAAQNIPAAGCAQPVAVAQPAFARPTYAQPVTYAHPTFAQPVAYAQPTFARPVAQPVYVQPTAYPVAQPVYVQPTAYPVRRGFGRAQAARIEAARIEAARIEAIRVAQIQARRDAMARGRFGRVQASLGGRFAR